MDRHLTTNKIYLCIEGTIGAGKTTLCRELAKHEDVFGPAPLIQFEPAEGVNPYLDAYYQNPARFAFQMQVFLLSKRYRAHLAAQSLALSGHCSVIADRSYFGDRCFAEIQHQLGYFSDNDLETYLALHKDMQGQILYPSAMVWLRVPPSLALERIAKRRSEIEGRQCEAGISEDYMVRLDEAIGRMMNSMRNHTNVIDVSPWREDGTERSPAQLADVIAEVVRTMPRKFDAWQGVA